MRRLLAPLLCFALPVVLAAPAPAGADVFGPISLVSKTATQPESSTQQAAYAHDAAISADGRYVAFDGSFGGATGVWRRDLQTGVVEEVAGGDAELPSIGENGRYISFTTTAKLSLDDTNQGPDVYVRDMARSISDSGAFALASAVNGSASGLTYEPQDPHFGSLATGRSALSADGRHVVFVTTAVSNLAGPGTPALQVAVRDLDSQTTQLVSAAYDPETGGPTLDKPVSGSEGNHVLGAVYSPGGSPPSFPFVSRSYKSTAPVGASISGDASTVAWMGQNIAEQARMLSAETPSPSYAEPLWRRIADGPQAPTRRVTGGSDPSNPACVASGGTALLQPASASDPCQGPFEELPTGIWSGGVGDAVPRLSADGREVIFLSNAKLLVRGSNFGLAEGAPSDLYVANMHDGLTRVQALRALTEFASGNTQDLAEDAPVVDLAISPDGSQVAFTTMRTAFPLGSPAYVTLPAAVPGMLELFDVDLADDTLTRVTHGFEGGASAQPHREVGAETDPYLATGVEAGALSPSFSGDGDTLAFSSTASNLVFGDGNTPQIEGSTTFDGSDAFVVSRVIFGSTPTPQDVSSPPANPSVAPVWDLGVTADSLRDGSVELEVEAPGAGSLSATAQSAATVTSGRSSRAAKRRARRGPARGGHVSTAVVDRAVAKSATHASAGGLVALTLTLAPRYRKLADEPGGLSGTVSLVFTAAGHQTLRQSIEVTFVRTRRRSVGRRAVSTHRRGARRGHRR